MKCDAIIQALRELLEELDAGREPEGAKIREIARLAQQCYGVVYTRGGVYVVDND